MHNNYLTEHTIGSIISGAFKIYFHHFSTIFIIFTLPSCLLQLVLHITSSSSVNPAFQILTLLIYFLAYFAIYAAITVSVSDICLGNSPSVKRAYTIVFGKRTFQLLGISILQATIIITGVIILILPGWIYGIETEFLTVLAILAAFIFAFWFLLTPPVVVLEASGGITALKRSKQLGDGSHWRNAGLYLLLGVVMAFISGVLGGLFSVFFAVSTEHWFFISFLTLMQEGLSMPISLIALVLVYYDRRVRKEGYDAKALAEDLAR